MHYYCTVFFIVMPRSDQRRTKRLRRGVKFRLSSLIQVTKSSSCSTNDRTCAIKHKQQQVSSSSSSVHKKKSFTNMSFLQRGADVAHKVVVSGLFTYACYAGFQIGSQIREHRRESQESTKQEHPQKEYIQTLREKADEDYSKHYKTDHRDWYDKDDDSYLKNAPRANRPGGQ